MKPSFSVIADGVDYTAPLKDRLLSLRVTDEAGLASDTFELALDDRDQALPWPPSGAVLSVAMGYEGEALIDMGRYTADEVEAAGPARTLTLRGKAADMVATLKSWKKRAWSKTTLGGILAKIAGEHGLTPAVAAEFEGITIDHLDQTYESDLNLITRLAERYGAVAKPAGGRLVFVRRGAGQDAEGDPLPTVRVAAADVIDWQASTRERQFYARVGAYYQDKRGARVVYVYAGEGEPVMYVRTPHRSERDALAAAESKLRRLQRGRTSLSLSMVGRAALCAETPIEVQGLRIGVDGAWVVTRAEHSISGGGFQTRIEAQRQDDFDAEREDVGSEGEAPEAAP